MPITRCSAQPSMTLEEFYSPSSLGQWYQYTGEQMLNFIQEINILFPTTSLFGLTSHNRLMILNTDSSESESFIILSALAGEYYFEYLIPTDLAPWNGAYVRGTAKSTEEAKTFLLIAMRECRGWVGNHELINNLKAFNL